MLGEVLDVLREVGRGTGSDVGDGRDIKQG